MFILLILSSFGLERHGDRMTGFAGYSLFHPVHFVNPVKMQFSSSRLGVSAVKRWRLSVLAVQSFP
jgi:hypothetical protein